VTIPSSAAIATDLEHFYPQFRSRGINCGMMVIALPLLKEEFTDKIVKKILHDIAYPLFYYIGYRLRLPLFSEKYDLSVLELNSVFSGGAKFFAEARGINGENLKAFEFGGAKNINWRDFEKKLNPKWLKNRTVRLRRSFGRYFGGNHFLEIQYVSDLEEQSARNLGLEKNQVVVMLHTAGESLEDVISPELKEKYIMKNSFIFMPSGNKDYEIFTVAHDMLMNYGYAYRLAAFALINDTVKKVLGNKKECRVILDKSHNHFMEEDLENGQKIVYRHNAERLLPEEFALLSGSYDHKSYIVKGENGLKDSLFTIDHGLGKILDFGRKKHYNANDIVKLYRLKNGLNFEALVAKKTISEMEDERVKDYFEVMTKERILKPVVSLRPLYNMKFC